MQVPRSGSRQLRCWSPRDCDLEPAVLGTNPGLPLLFAGLFASMFICKMELIIVSISMVDCFEYLMRGHASSAQNTASVHLLSANKKAVAVSLCSF